MWKGRFHDLRPQTPAEVFSHMPPESLSCKECRTDLSARGALRLRAVLRPLEVAYASRTGADPDELQAADPGRPPLAVALQRLPARAAPREGPLPAGFTPLLRVDRLAEPLGLGEVWIKNDAANPTHSFKDRVVSVALARARELGFKTVACASTGNLANAVAAHAAAAGLESYVFVPWPISRSRRCSRPASTGRTSSSVRGTYDEVNRLCTELSAEHEWAFVNINLRPYYARDQRRSPSRRPSSLGFALPDRVVCPIASGSLFTKIARGFDEWIELGLLERRAARRSTAPRPPAARRWPRAFGAGHDFCQPVKPETIAKSLAIGNPADGPYALDLARRTGGSIESVTDEEIREGIKLLAETTGIFTEAAGGVTVAVLAKLAQRGEIDPVGARRRLHHRRGLEDARLRPGHIRGLGGRADARVLRARPGASRRRRVGAAGRYRHCPPHGRHSQDPDPAAGRHRTARQSAEVEGATVGEVLDALYDRYDELRDRIAEDGGLRRFVNVYVGGEDIRFLDGLDTTVSDGDEVTILPAVAGG